MCILEICMRSLVFAFRALPMRLCCRQPCRVSAHERLIGCATGSAGGAIARRSHEGEPGTGMCYKGHQGCECHFWIAAMRSIQSKVIIFSLKQFDVSESFYTPNPSQSEHGGAELRRCPTIVESESEDPLRPPEKGAELHPNWTEIDPNLAAS